MSGKKREESGKARIHWAEKKKQGQSGAKEPLNEKPQKRRQSQGFGALFGTQV
jgi:hypothetical protein